MTKKQGETSYRETAFGIIPRSKLIPFEIEGIKRAWDFVLEKRKKTKISITPFMDSYCKDLAEKLKHLPNLNQADFLEELVHFLAWTHQRFLWIHPFKGYNGRIGRLIVNVILLNLDLPPIELKVETKTGRRKYVEALKNADDGNCSDLEKIIKEAIEETIEELAVYDEK